MANKKRNGKYQEWITEEGLVKIQGWAMDGLIDKEIAEKIGVVERTFTRWKKEYPQIMSVLKEGKQVVDRKVELSLYERAMGFEYEETKIIIEKDENGKDRKRQERIIKRALPDTTAQIFWLKNRKPVEWRDRHELQHVGRIDISERADEIEKRLFGKEE